MSAQHDHSTGTTSILPRRLGDFLTENLADDVVGTGDALEITAPALSIRLASLPSATAADVRRAAAHARGAQEGWARRPVRERAAILLRLHDEIRRNEALILDVIQAETGKSRLHAYDEILDAYNVCRFVGRSAEDALARERRRGALPMLTSTSVDHLPMGLVGFITPWNYPVSLGATDLLAALVAGNAVVHKPDSQTVLSAILLRRLAMSAGLPSAVWQLVPGPVDEVGDELLDAVDGISFTGSTAAGRGIAASAGHALKPATLELGGKNPMIVCADASLDAAVDGAIRGCFSSTGQLCLSIERIYVAESLYETFCERFARATAELRLGFSFDHGHGVGSLISANHLQRVRTAVDDAVGKGARVLAGGSARLDLGPCFFEPTVLTDVPSSARLTREETFGPVVAVYSVTSDDDAVDAANDTPYGLNASVYSGDRAHGLAVARRLEAGMVNVNEAFAAAWGSVAAPSGGVKASGLGHRHGREGIREFTRSRTVAHQSFLPIAPSGRLTPERFQRIFTGALAAMKAARLR
ncbi:succinic semialdehyde dehydrogenase [uncultured Kocuria sp.]|uniref:succinic semialdehyde dehydrogenase n=1 Tax=uncultured Kocuria sp. TaxID=259305 RepID=UPI002594D67B|nr:succinic semialdehyde dehydrogenase [uncultured Kocuria sp.]MCT1367096.1 succinic semialdehyde dehydrogenase [Rothia sp. p3-SID1597]